MNKIKDHTMNFIIEEALSLFMKKSITGVTMSDIAKEVEIGDATLYRYFKKKQNIVISAVMKLSDSVLTKYFLIDEQLSGYEQIKRFYLAYLNVFHDHKEYFKFINEFDAYLIIEKNIDKIEYEHEIQNYKELFINAYNKGISDGSIKKRDNIDLFYYSTTHALLSLCKGLSNKEVLSLDENTNKEGEINTLIDIILNSLS